MEKNISKYLAFRWMALYMLFYDDNLDRLISPCLRRSSSWKKRSVGRMVPQP